MIRCLATATIAFFTPVLFISLSNSSRSSLSCPMAIHAHWVNIRLTCGFPCRVILPFLTCSPDENSLGVNPTYEANFLQMKTVSYSLAHLTEFLQLSVLFLQSFYKPFHTRCLLGPVFSALLLSL